MKKKMILMILVGLMAVMLPLWVQAETESGTCGINVNWTLDDDGVLTISGTGEMTQISWEAKKVKKAIVQSGVTKVYFSGCQNMTSVMLPDSVKSLSTSAFNNCNKLENITIPNGVTGIPDRAFFCCYNLAEITIPDSVTTIGAYAFRSCGSLQTLALPKGLKSIGSSAFTYCYYLTGITIPKGVSAIPAYAFSGCTRLATITIDGTIMSVGNNAFMDCTALKSVEYAGTDGWDAVAIGSGNAALKAAIGAEVLESGTCGDNIQWTLTGERKLKITGSGRMKDYSAGNTPWLSIKSLIRSIELGSGITYIGTYALSQLSPETQTEIPASVTEFGEGAFAGFAGILRFTGHAPTLPEYVFSSGRIIGLYPKDDASWTAVTGNTYGGRMVVWRAEEADAPDGQRDPSEETESEKSDNENRYAALPITSYLTEGDGGTLYRIEYANGKIVVEQYNEQKQVIWKKTLPMELPYWGGFYRGTDYNFIVVGDANPDEDEEKEILRVIRYSRNWNRIDHASIFGANTTIPFRAGTLRMAQSGDFLFVHTCHQMYQSSDGLNHQANMNYQLYVPAMRFVNSHYVVSNPGADYVSHSFDQYVLIDGENVIKVDLGDAYPRAVTVLRKAGTANSLDDEKYERVSLLKISGGTGNNYTGVALGGAEVTGAGYLAAGVSVDQSRFNETNRNNVFTAFVPRDSFTDESVRFRWITGYADDDKRTLSAPQMVKISAARFLLMWTETAEGTRNADRTLKYVFLDGEGATTSAIYEANGLMSDCRPIVRNDRVTWYVTSGAATVFYTIDLNNPGTVTIEARSQWLYENGYRVYYSADGKKTTGFKQIDTERKTYNWDTQAYETVPVHGTYWFDGDGHMQTGLQAIEGKKYYFDDEGIMQSGFRQVGDDTYYFTENGALTGLQAVGTEGYAYNPETEKYEVTTVPTNFYFDAEGRMQTGWQTIGGKKYYFGENGRMRTGFIALDGDQYYLAADGAATGLREIESEESVYNRETGGFDKQKVLKSYYFDADGKMQTGWQTIGGKKYYFSEDGHMVTGFRSIDNKTYYFTENGMATGLQEISGKIYCFGEDGAMIKGLYTTGGATYYFLTSSAMTGIQYINGEKYYFGPDGKMQTGFQTVSGTTYYFTESGAATGLKTIDGKKYFFNSYGEMRTGFLWINDDLYYFTKDGVLTGRQEINGKQYLFGDDGVWIEGDEPEAPHMTDPKADDPQADDSQADDPQADDPQADDPQADDPGMNDPQANDPKIGNPEDGEKRLPGDINDDGEVDGRDAVRLMKYLAGEIDPATGVTVEIKIENADLNADGYVDGLDLLRLMRFLGGEIPALE